jgi:hypothetical protein
MPSPTAAVAASLSKQTTTKAYNHNPTPQPPRVLYCLAAVVCHYGQHSFGHYVCYRRKPRGSGRVGPPRLNGFHATPGRGWLRASDDAVREVGIETVLQEGSGAFMLYYERVRNEDKPSSVPVWTSHSRATTTDDGDDDDLGLGDIDDDYSGQENARRHRSQQDVVVKRETGSEVDDGEMEEVPVIKARVVRSVSLGAGDDFDGGSVSVKHEAEVEKGDGDGDEGPDSEARLPQSRPSSPTLAKSEHVEPPSSVSTEAPSPIPEAPAVDEPPIGAVPQS